MHIQSSGISCGIVMLCDVHYFTVYGQSNTLPLTHNIPPVYKDKELLTASQRNYETVIMPVVKDWSNIRKEGKTDIHKGVCYQHMDYLAWYTRGGLTYLMSDPVTFKNCECLADLLKMNGFLKDIDTLPDRENPNTKRTIRTWAFRLIDDWKEYKVRKILDAGELIIPDMKDYLEE